MMRVRKHIDRYGRDDGIPFTQHLKIPCLCSGITTHINYTLRGGSKQVLDDIRVHPCARRVGDDDIRLTMLAPQKRDRGVTRPVPHKTLYLKGR